MKTFYNVEIQMSGTHSTSQHFIEQIATDLGADAKAIDEMEAFSATLFFDSELKPSEIEDRLWAVLGMYRQALHYIDVVYRYENEMTPDRFVLWANGTKKEYTGKVFFEEDK